MTSNYEQLKQRQRAQRDAYPDDFGLRVHRALSWLQRSEQCEDMDGRFIFLWIAFNAAYAQNFYIEGSQERKIFGDFIDKLVQLDKDKVLYNLIWSEYSESIRLLLDNQYVFKPFWDFQNKQLTKENWEKQFEHTKKKIHKALSRQQTSMVLQELLSRMYTLRNQLIHGGATWSSAVNRDQLTVCTAFLGKLVPFVIALMMDHPQQKWGDILYPPI